MAITLGAIPLLFGVGLLVWTLRALEGRKRTYVTARACLYLVLGVGMIGGHWAPAVGLALIGLSAVGLIAIAVARRRILGVGGAPTTRR